MKIAYFIFKFLIILLLFISSTLLTVLYTHVGSKFAWNIVQSQLDFISGDLVDGCIGTGFQLENFKFDIGFVQINVDKVKTSIDLSQVTSLKFLVKYVEADNVNMKLNFDETNHDPIYDEFKLSQITDIWQGNKDAKTKYNEKEFALDYILKNNQKNVLDKSIPFYVDLPINVKVDSLKVKNYQLDSSLFHLNVDNFFASAGLTHHLIYNAQVNAENIDFYLKDSDTNEPISYLSMPKLTDGFDKKQVFERLTTLPTVYIPFDIEIASLKLPKARFHMNGYDTDLIDASIEGAVHQSEIYITKAVLLSKQYGDFTLKGGLKIQDYLHLDFDLDGVCQYGILGDDLKNIPVEASVHGQLTDMNVELKTKDHRKINVVGRLNVLDGLITSQLDLQYSNITWPLRANANSYIGKLGKEETSEHNHNKEESHKDSIVNKNAIKNNNENEALVSVAQGSLHFVGDLNKFDINLNTIFAYQNNKPFSIITKAKGLYDDFSLEELSIFKEKENKLTIVGDFLYKNELLSLDNITLTSHKTPLNYYLGLEGNDELSGKLNGNFSYNFKENEISFAIKNTDIKGILSSLQLAISGNAIGAIDIDNIDKSSANFDNLLLAFGDNSIKINGSLKPSGSNEIFCKILAKNLGEITSPFIENPINGEAELNVKVIGNFTSPMLSIVGSINSLSQKNIFEVKKLKVDVKENFDINNFSFNGDLRIDVAEMLFGNNNIKSTMLHVIGNEQKHNIRIITSLNEQYALDTHFDGVLSKNNYQVTVSKFSLNSPFQPLVFKNKPKITYSFDDQKIDYGQIVLVNGGMIVNLQKGYYYIPSGVSSVHGKISQLNSLKFYKYFPENVLINATFNGKFDFEKKSAHEPFVATASLISKNGSFTNSVSSTVYKELSLNFDLNSDKSAKVNFLLDGDRYGSISLNANYDLVGKGANNQSINLDINDFDLELIAPLLPKLDLLQGKINTHGAILRSGTKGLFYYNGKVVLTNGRIVTEAEIATVDKINIELNIDEKNLKVDGSFDLGAGEGKIAGNLDIEPIYDGKPPLGEIVMTGDKLDVSLAGYGHSVVNYKTVMTFANIKGEDKLILRGDINIPEASIIIKSMGNSGIDISEDVLVVENRNDENLKKKKIKVPAYVDYKVNVNIGPEISLKGYGLTTNLEGSISISNHSENNELQMLGIINLVDGKFKSFGQNLQIRMGKIEFNGNPNNTSAFVEAIRDPESINDSSGVIVGVRVIKTVNSIDLKIFSEPEMSEQEKLSYLINGNSLIADGDTGSSSAAATGMLLNASLSGASMALSDIASDIGLSDFQLETTGSGSNSQVSASANLTKKLKVSYGYGLFDSIGEFKVRYELLKKLFVQFVNSTDQAVDLFYSFSID